MTVVLPDAELLAVEVLRDHADVAAIVGARVYTEIPADAVFPLLRLTRVGGRPLIRGWHDQARLQIDAYAATKEAARLLAATAQAALHAAEGTVRDTAVIGAVDTVSGPSWTPDALTDRPRYLLDMTLNTHPR